ncbi:fluoride efflux transporter FluC [Natrialbaceae archaeon A-arb3/5]
MPAAATFDPEPAHIVGTGGAIGAICRHWVYRQFADERFPWPTLAVNVIGSFVFGAAIFAGAGESTIQLLGIGACGAFTTFSSFSVETVQLYERGDRRLAVANAGGNLALSLAAIGLAWVLVAAVGL